MSARPVELSAVLLSFLFLCLLGGCALLNGDGGPTPAASVDTSTWPRTFTNTIGSKLLLIEGGTFDMGSDALHQVTPKSQIALFGPRHQVTLDSFYMAAFEVTKGQFRRFLQETGGSAKPYEELDPTATTLERDFAFLRAPSDDFPVYHVDWHGAVKFCEWLSEKEGVRYRLPTEAEWEYAARAGTTTQYWWGETWLMFFASVSDSMQLDVSPLSALVLPGTYPANPWGLYEILGNTHEWTQDWWDRNYYAESPNRNPQGPIWGFRKVIRGGSFDSQPPACTVDWRFSFPKGDFRGGIRLVREISPTSRPADSPERQRGPRCVLEERPVVQVPFGEGDVLRLVQIDGGTFTLGSPESDPFTAPGESVRTDVTLSKPFLLAVHEVTQAQYEAVVGQNPSAFPGPDRPVEQVTWLEAVAFCEALTKREREAGRLEEGKSYRLPSESEWEYACRAGTTTRYFFGDEVERVADFGWVDVLGGTRPVGQLYANPRGLHDVYGNVWEWTSDPWWRAKYSYGKTISRERALKFTWRVARGGGWNFAPHRARSGARYTLRYDTKYNFVGFRVARDL